MIGRGALVVLTVVSLAGQYSFAWRFSAEKIEQDYEAVKEWCEEYPVECECKNRLYSIWDKRVAGEESAITDMWSRHSKDDGSHEDHDSEESRLSKEQDRLFDEQRMKREQWENDHKKRQRDYRAEHSGENSRVCFTSGWIFKLSGCGETEEMAKGIFMENCKKGSYSDEACLRYFDGASIDQNNNPKTAEYCAELKELGF